MARNPMPILRFEWVAVGTTLLYAAIALYSEAAPGRPELFPFASWNLFSMIPNGVTIYDIEFATIDGTELETPVPFRRSYNRFDHYANHMAHVVIRRLATAVTDGSDDQDRLRHLLEDLYIRPNARAADYTLVRLHFPRDGMRVYAAETARTVIARFRMVAK